MKKLMLMCGLLFAASPASANENRLEMFSPQLLCKHDSENKFRPYTYHASFFVKNTADKEVTLATKMSGGSLSKRADGQYDLTFLLNPVQTINDIPLIPSIVDFKLVTLRPGEATNVNRIFKSKKHVTKAGFHYSIKDHYDDRFGFWTGRLSLYDIDLKNPGRCGS